MTGKQIDVKEATPKEILGGAPAFIAFAEQVMRQALKLGPDRMPTTAPAQSSGSVTSSVTVDENGKRHYVLEADLGAFKGILR